MKFKRLCLENNATRSFDQKSSKLSIRLDVNKKPVFSGMSYCKNWHLFSGFL